MKKVQSWDSPAAGHSGWLCTYYVYDDLDNLRYVVSPKAVEWLTGHSWNFANTGGDTVARELCYRYEYDARNRVIIKKIPGAGEFWAVYDVRDRVVMTQDSVDRKAGKWVVIKYDNQDRPDSSGLLTDTGSRTYHQNLAYNSTNYPATSGGNFECLSRTFYDDYQQLSAVTSVVGSSLATQYTTNGSYFITSYNTAPYYARALVADSATRGQVTGTMTKVINQNYYLYSAHFYDDRGRLIQTESSNYSGGVDTLTAQYDFSGKPLRSFSTNINRNNTVQYHRILTKMSYDAMARPTSAWKNIDNASSDQLIDSMRYDELGQLQVKYLGSNLDSLHYDYNIRGWLRYINRNYITSTSSTPLNYFGMELNYDSSASITGNTSYLNPAYNGNVSGTVWKSAGDGVRRKYDFTYDNVNRLTGAAFLQNTTGNSWDNSKINFAVNGLSYDANGNIMTMNQHGFKLGGSVTIDSLAYNYLTSSNKLNQVQDAANDTVSKLGDFHYKGTQQSQGYSYDGNGNLVLDNNKGITNITYNYLNLPEYINIKGKGAIQYGRGLPGNRKCPVLQYPGYLFRPKFGLRLSGGPVCNQS